MASSIDTDDMDGGSSVEQPPIAVQRKVEYSGARPKPSEKSRGRFNIADRNTHRVVFDQDAILKAANDHECYHIRRYILHNLPKYDDCTPYITETSKLDELFRAEMQKLIQFAENDDPPIFDSEGCLQGVGCKDFEDISNLADQMQCISSVLTHDNSRHGVSFGTQVANEAWISLIVSRSNLRTRYAKDDMHVEGQQPVTLEDSGQSQRNARAFHALLDYILAVMAWWLVRCADSEYWRTHVLTALAGWAVKMKIISADPVRCVEHSLSETTGMIEGLKTEAEYNDVLIKVGGKKTDAEDVQTQTNFCNLYCEEKSWIRGALGSILNQVLEAFLQDDKSGIPANLFEVCTMVYRRDTEPERSGKIWTGSRHGDVGASSSLRHITFCYNLSKLLKLHFDKVKQASRPPKSSSDDYVKVSGAVRENGSTPFDLQVYKMDHAITLLTPLILMQPSTARQISLLMNTAMAFMGGKEVLRVFAPPPTDFALEFTLSTSAWLKAHEVTNPKTNGSFDPDIRSLSQSPLKRGLGGTLAIENQFSSGGSEKVAEIQTKYTANISEMLKWNIRTTEIVVLCRTYVRWVQALAALLVLGGLAIPFSVGERITGVDPFQIATYTWLLAGFTLIAAKSLFVDNWPWNDFLHGHVKCQSVSDLSEVSGIDPQIILLFLLRNEWNNLLVTDGPYNGMFRRTLERRGKKTRQNDAGTTVIMRQGFSIDEPLHVYTMLASGIVPLKVRDGHGEHLICIDGRKGGWDMANSGKSLNWMTCPNFNSEDLENMYDGDAKASGERTVHMLERVKFEWARVLGVYVKDAYFG